MTLRSTQPLTEMSTRDVSWQQMQPMHRADNLATLMCRPSRNSGSLDLSESRPVALPFTLR